MCIYIYKVLFSKKYIYILNKNEFVFFFFSTGIPQKCRIICAPYYPYLIFKFFLVFKIFPCAVEYYITIPGGASQLGLLCWTNIFTE